MTMLAAVYHGPNDLRAETVARPRPTGGEVLVRVSGCGLCGTDRRIVAGGHRFYPEGTTRTPGHEIVGEIVETGPEAPSDLPRGPIVVGPNFGCGRCRQCLSGNNNRCADFQALGITRDGGFAQYVLVPALSVAQGNLIPLSADIDPRLGVLVEPMASVVRGQASLGIGPGDTVLVVGGGPIGLLHVALARLAGAARIILADRWDARLGIGETLGADRCVNVQEADLDTVLGSETGGTGADVVILAAPSNAAQATALEHAAISGRVSFFAGLPKSRSRTELETNLIHYKELTVSGTTACSTLDCMRAAEIISSGRIDLAPLLTTSLTIDQAPAAFSQNDRAQLKITIDPA